MPPDQKQAIKKYLSYKLDGVDLTTLFTNLDNNKVPKIFENPRINEAAIKRYNSNTKNIQIFI